MEIIVSSRDERYIVVKRTSQVANSNLFCLHKFSMFESNGFESNGLKDDENYAL